jgi:hypothetical protein
MPAKKRTTKAKPTKRMGRPPIDNPATARISVRVTEEQRARYHRTAEAHGMGLSALIESLLDRAAAKYDR